MNPFRRKAGKSSPSKTSSPATIRSLKAVGSHSCKVQGEAAEAAFLAKAAGFGFGIAKPWGDSERYDFILDSGRRFSRIQVKSGSHPNRSCGYCIKLFSSTGRYTCDEIDFVVAYIVPANVWYVVPIQIAVGRLGLYFNPGGRGRSRLESFREAWCQLACPRQGPVLVNVPRRCRSAAGEDIPCPFHREGSS